MKRLYALLPLLAALVVPGTLSAQMMPDSTVQIVAYWEVGDKIDYVRIEEQYEIKGEEETLTSSSSESFYIEVVAATDSTYTLEIDSRGGFSSSLLGFTEKEKESLSKLFSSPLRIRTSQYGTFEEFENPDEFLESFKKIIPVITDLTWRKYTPEQQKGIDKKALENYFQETLCSPYTITTLCQQYIAPFFYHGARLDTTRTYSLQNTFNGLVGNASVTLETLFKVDSELTDDYSAVIRQETVANDDEILPLAKEYTLSLIQSFSEDSGLSREEFEKSLQEHPFRMGFEEYTVVEIELETGWPIAWIFDRYVTAEQNGESSGKHIYRKIKIETGEETEAAGETE